MILLVCPYLILCLNVRVCKYIFTVEPHTTITTLRPLSITAIFSAWFSPFLLYTCINLKRKLQYRYQDLLYPNSCLNTVILQYYNFTYIPPGGGALSKAWVFGMK